MRAAAQLSLLLQCWMISSCVWQLRLTPATVHGAQEDEGTKEAKNHQLLTEDIDSILARAEVRDTMPAFGILKCIRLLLHLCLLGLIHIAPARGMFQDMQALNIILEKLGGSCVICASGSLKQTLATFCPWTSK